MAAAKALRDARVSFQINNSPTEPDAPLAVAVNAASAYPLGSPEFLVALRNAPAFANAICGGPCPTELDPLVDAVAKRLRDRLHYMAPNARGRGYPLSKLTVWKALSAEARELEAGVDSVNEPQDGETTVVLLDSPDLAKLRGLKDRHQIRPDTVQWASPGDSLPPLRKMVTSTLSETDRIAKEIKDLLDHPRVMSKHRAQVVLFHPEEPEFAGAFGYEHVKDGLAFTWSSHGMPGRAEVRNSAKSDEVTELEPEDVADILTSHPLFASHATVFVNSCYSGVSARGGKRSLAAEVARLTGKATLGWMGSVNTKYFDGKNLLWVERHGQHVPLSKALVLFHPDGRTEPIQDPQSLFAGVVLID